MLCFDSYTTNKQFQSKILLVHVSQRHVNNPYLGEVEEF